MNKPDHNNANERFLANWLAGKISDQELQQRVSEEDYLAYQKIKTSLATMELPDPDMDANYTDIRKKIAEGATAKKSKVRILFPYVAVAASLLVLFGLFQLFAFSNSDVTKIGATSSLVLADNSAVTLNANSKISYPELFEFNRKVKLDGEAHFNVRKGSKCQVMTKNGTVTVLGTQFNVISKSGFFEVTCFEGRVLVESRGQSEVLNQGDAIRFSNNHVERWKQSSGKPTWIDGETTFRNAAFKIVVDQFKDQYNYQISYPRHLDPIKFSGTFPNKDIGTALQSICLPLDLKYQINGREIVISE